MFKKILIVGGSGFIGSHFQEAFETTQIVNLDIQKPTFTKGAPFFEGDIRNTAALDEALRGCDCVINLAAAHKDFGISREEYFSVNEEGSRLLAQAAARAGVKHFIFFSSAAVYGDSDPIMVENSPTNPVSPYGESKLAAEKVLKIWAAEDPSRSVLVIRPVVIYGERNFANVYRLMAAISKRRYFNVGKGDNIKSIAYVKNLVDATKFLMERMTSGFSIYNYADNPQLSSRQIGETIAEALGKPKPMTLPIGILYAMALPFDLLITITGKDLPISTTRVKKFATETCFKGERIEALGFKPRFSNVEGLQRMSQWFLNGKNGQVMAQQVVENQSVS